ncbi:MAG: hypothetical protein ABIO70_03470 [Pseudomonadota bacterium]
MLSTLLLLATTATPVQAGEFMDTWITLGFEDTNIMAGPEYESPAANFVMRGNRTFFEDYESKYSDDITQSRLVLYRRDEGFWKDWYTEAAFALRFQPFLEADQSSEGVQIRDDGSYVRLVKKLGGAESHTLSFTGYAIDASRFRLGYSYDLSWGGKEIFLTDPKASPGARIEWQKGGSYLFVGAKTSIQKQEPLDDVTEDAGRRNQAFYGVLAGGGLELAEKFKVEAGVGSFQQGQLTTNDDVSDPLYGEPVEALGVGAQAAWRSTTELSFIQSADLKLLRNGPDFVKDTYITHDQLDGFGMLVQAEWNVLTHNLLNADKEGATILENAMAGDLQTKFVFGGTSLGVDLVYKDLSYIVFNIPGISSGVSTPEWMETSPQLYGRLFGSHYFEKAHLAPYAGVGLMQPASYVNAQGNAVVQVTERDILVVPEGEDATNILGALGGVQVDASKSVVIVGEVLYTSNHNKSDYEEDPVTGMSRPVPVSKWEANELGFNLMMRARF